MLNTKDALKLYSMLKDYLPNQVPKTGLEFVGTIVNNINDAGDVDAYPDSILLMHPEISLDELAEMNPSETIKLFLDGLMDNDIMALKLFCTNIGM